MQLPTGTYNNNNTTGFRRLLIRNKQIGRTCEIAGGIIMKICCLVASLAYKYIFLLLLFN